MSRHPLLFWVAVSLAAHLALLACLADEQSTIGNRRRSLAVQLVTPTTAPTPPAVAPPLPGIAPRSSSSSAQRPTPPAPAPAIRPSIPLSPATAADPATAAAALTPRPSPTPAPRPEAAPESMAPPPALAAEAVPTVTRPAAPPASPPATAAVDGATAAETAEPPLLEAQPLYADNPPPAYPRLARQRGWEGEVLLLVRVGSSGKVLAARVERSTGYPVLDKAALEAVRDWRFRPARRGPLPVESEVRVPVRFRLERG